ncbi:DUF6307 family protein [Amycolatopsis cihanbeyliensis]|uniref:Uncharacterized protein n=1 Tax=Amycolatopsis cihanbeyliensis TaxID=1128664 RepID=A0A542DGS1_AMYCI|nr:DUF6307 family protein [Amycolatopsis cihanbeyliensis]TQJ02266.1 hypothetical protein FB471_1988 [Amycolatopsis cihanbeyliensis]
MTSSPVFVSRYDQRIKLVQDVLKEHTTYSDEKCRELAVQVLHTVDTIPEKMR